MIQIRRRSGGVARARVRRVRARGAAAAGAARARTRHVRRLAQHVSGGPSFL